ncbi:hypothetical protein T484DRAFT_1864837 [Baffinella frigidus]|nr:hypothetical protein T484DRAFT_1864837 [Cryptophyta sp. CCMP2293]
MPSKPVAARKFKCSVDGCNVSRQSPAKLQEHVDFIHNKIYRDVCDHINEKGVKCGYKCETRGNLDGHKLYKHSDVRGHKCTVCSKAFKKAQHLDDHYAAKHAADDDPERTRHKCEVCNKGCSATHSGA